MPGGNSTLLFGFYNPINGHRSRVDEGHPDPPGPASAGDPVAEDFREVEVRLPDPAPGQVLVRNVLMSVDPYMRVRMAKLPTYPAWEIGDALDGSAIGVIVSSAAPPCPPGPSSPTATGGGTTR
ncbi:hypothetical protein [Actinomadura madurae]|uniref:hypothetical protein n=1 Tax=Actinomadura madurae TaxID=1993 RepID=UPI0027E39960|nr:hypothetical protein [Actinomadura madurae]